MNLYSHTIVARGGGQGEQGIWQARASDLKGRLEQEACELGDDLATQF